MSRNSFIQAAFHQAIPDATEADPWYVILTRETPFYIGPQEGGTWGSDLEVVAYKEYPSAELAERAAASVRKLAQELSEEAKRDFGRYCQVTCEWLDARGLDSDYLPEVNGSESYSVSVQQKVPQDHHGCRQYS